MTAEEIELLDILRDELDQRLILPYSSDPLIPLIEPWHDFNRHGLFVGRQVAALLMKEGENG